MKETRLIADPTWDDIIARDKEIIRLHEAIERMRPTPLEKAAPALLAALTCMIRHYAPNALESPEWTLSGNTQTDAILRAARAAIAQATT